MTHDDIFACLDGVVQVAENKAANGNYVIIKHDNVPDPANMTEKTTLYSCYLHLSELSVTAGQLVSEGDVIGKCGNTGNVSGSTGEHLHFQLDRKEASFHPYWPFTLAESKAAGLGFFESINKGLGIENARKYTVNPLVYLDQIETSDATPARSSSTPVATPTETVVTTTVVVTTTATATSAPIGFTDVATDHQYVTAINFLKSKDIVG